MQAVASPSSCFLLHRSGWLLHSLASVLAFTIVIPRSTPRDPSECKVVIMPRPSLFRDRASASRPASKCPSHTRGLGTFQRADQA